MSKFLDSEILNYTIKNLVSQIDKTFLKKKVLFNVTPAYYRLFDSTTDNPSDKLTVIANGLTPTTGQVTSDTVRFITKNPTVYAVGAEVVFIEEIMTPKFDNVIGLTEQELDDVKALTPTDRADKYFSNILFVVDDTKLVFYDKVLDSFTDCTSGEKVVKLWQSLNNYKVGDVVKYNNHIYECITEHTSNAIFDDDESSKWIYKMEVYYSLTKDQYDMLVANGTITAENKNLYIVDDNNDYPSEYEMDFTDLDTVLVQHNLNETFPSKVYIFDEDGNEIVLPEIEYNSMNLLTISFAFPITGKVIVKK